MRIKMTGKKHTAEARKKMSNAKKGIAQTPEHSASIAASLKKTLSMPEQKAKISAERKGRVHSEQRKSRTAESMKRVWAKRLEEKGPKPDVLPGRNTPEESRLLRNHLVSLSQRGKGPRYTPSEEQRKARAKTVRRVWAERKGIICHP